jgi:hypothetical protein
LINIVPFVRAHVARLVAIVLVGALAAPAITECAGWSALAADRHACCAGRGDLASEASVTNCCANSEQSNDVAPPESQAARPLFKHLLGADVSPVADLFLPSRTPLLTVSSAARGAALVPLYLQQTSLLI